MTPGEARAVLGIGSDVDAAALRAAYRERLRATHPDLAGAAGNGGRQRGNDATADVVTAYRLLCDQGRAAASPSIAPVKGDDVAVRVEGDTVSAELPAGDLFMLLLDAAHAMGEVTYVDHQAGLLETIVEFEGYPAASVVFTLQGRSSGVTEAWCTVEALSGGPAPPHAAVAALFAEALRRTIAAARP